MIYFTSDLHFGHEQVLELCRRPFRNVQDMNISLIERFNDVVKPADTVYILGDVAHRMPLSEVQALLFEMNGSKVLLPGNHDLAYDYAQPYQTKNGRMVQLFDEITDMKIIQFEKRTLVLMHYPMLSWLDSRRGTIMLHGHIHATSGYNTKNQAMGLRRFDVGVDANNYAPVSITEIIQMVRSCRKSADYDNMKYYLDAVMKPG